MGLIQTRLKTGNIMALIKLNTVNWKRFIVLLLFSLLTTILFTTAGVGWIFSDQLIHPGCSPSTHQEDFESVSVLTKDGIQLNGWWHPPQNGAAILIISGLGGSRDAMLTEARILRDAGFGTLTLDNRSCRGSLSTIGLAEKEDINTGINFLQQQPEVERIGALGFSAGSVTLIYSAAENPEIEALILEGNFANFQAEIDAPRSIPLSIEWQLKQWVTLFFRIRTGIWPAEIDPINQLSRIVPRPILFIHGEKEAGQNQATDQFQQALPNATLWIVPGSGHGDYLESIKDTYAQNIIDFFSTHLK
jgi:pimeloyl-ACP methyl ester carboxylesterase